MRALTNAVEQISSRPRPLLALSSPFLSRPVRWRKETSATRKFRLQPSTPTLNSEPHVSRPHTSLPPQAWEGGGAPALGVESKFLPARQRSLLPLPLTLACRQASLPNGLACRRLTLRVSACLLLQVFSGLRVSACLLRTPLPHHSHPREPGRYRRRLRRVAVRTHPSRKCIAHAGRCVGKRQIGHGTVGLDGVVDIDGCVNRAIRCNLQRTRREQLWP